MGNMRLDQDSLESFLNENGYPIGKSTILKYVSDGLILAPKRFSNLGSLSSSRVYYNPLAIIETMVIVKMTNGIYKDMNQEAKIAKFTLDDIFWARIFFYYDRDDNSIPVCDFSNTIKFAKKDNKASVAFSMDRQTLVDLLDEKAASTDGYTKEYIFERWHQYEDRIPDVEIRVKYIECLKSIYSSMFAMLERQYEEQLRQYSLSEY